MGNLILVVVLVVSILVSLVLEIVFGSCVGFLGAIVGILCPADTRRMAKRQQLATKSLIGSVVFLLAAFTARFLSLPAEPFWASVILGVVLGLVFMITGNSCRREFERSSNDS